MPANTLICLLWSVRELGKPTKEGEFCSLHPTDEALVKFVDQYWQSMPTKTIPDDYACPAAQENGSAIPPYLCQVDPKTYKRIVNSGLGMWSTTVPKQSTEVVSVIPESELMSPTVGIRAS